MNLMVIKTQELLRSLPVTNYRVANHVKQGIRETSNLHFHPALQENYHHTLFIIGDNYLWWRHTSSSINQHGITCPLSVPVIWVGGVGGVKIQAPR